jgi:hypothetical protein
MPLHHKTACAAAVCALLLCLVDLSAAVNKKLPSGTARPACFI